MFFDIETTGFRASVSHLYLIGAAWKSPDTPGKWVIRQMLSEYPQSEAALLRSFCDIAGSYKTIIHFNGSRFDIPYLQEKYESFQIPDPFHDMDSVDLYAMLRPYKDALGMDHLNQRSVEEFLRLYREDPFDGGKLIPVYYKFCKSREDSLLSVLLRHNREDVSGMMYLTRMAVFIRMFQYLSGLDTGDFRISTAGGTVLKDTSGREMVQIRFSLNSPLGFPVPLSRDDEIAGVRLKDYGGVLTIPVLNGTLYHFFSDWSNYYYLPAEDMAVHKSVASFVDPKWRKKATQRTCYIRRAGQFLPLLSQPQENALQRRYQDPVLWAPYNPSACSDPAWCTLQVHQILPYLFSLPVCH